MGPLCAIRDSEDRFVVQISGFGSLYWNPIQLDQSTLPPQVLHGRNSGNVVIKVFRTTLKGKVGEAHPDSLFVETAIISKADFMDIIFCAPVCL